MTRKEHVTSASHLEARASLLRLIAAALVSLVLLALLLPSWGAGLAGGFTSSGEQTRREAAKRDRPRNDREIQIGQDHSKAASVAWIAYDDFRALQAQQARTEQPAAQQQADPTDGAPLELEATPPVPPAPQENAIAASQAAPLDAVATPAPSASGAPPSIEFEAQASPRLDFAPVAEVPSAAAAAARTTASASGEPAKPTSAPRADLEVTATQLTETPVKVQPGKVVAVEGITIKTAHPDVSLIAKLTGRPRANPQANITFDLDGMVLKVELTRSAGVDNWDGPIVASFYRWRAGGEKLKAMREPFIVPITFIISEELEGD